MRPACASSASGRCPPRVVVYYLLAMVLFFQSGYGEVWNKLVAGLDWARRFRVRAAAGHAAVAGGGHPGAQAAGLAGDGGRCWRR